jgi:hypothetical protein
MGEWLKECELSLRCVSWSGRSAHIRTPRIDSAAAISPAIAAPADSRLRHGTVQCFCRENPLKYNLPDSLLF